MRVHLPKPLKTFARPLATVRVMITILGHLWTNGMKRNQIHAWLADNSPLLVDGSVDGVVIPNQNMHYHTETFS